MSIGLGSEGVDSGDFSFTDSLDFFESDFDSFVLLESSFFGSSTFGFVLGLTESDFLTCGVTCFGFSDGFFDVSFFVLEDLTGVGFSLG